MPNLTGHTPLYNPSVAIGSISDGGLPNITGTISVYTASGTPNNDATGVFQMFNGTGKGESYVFAGSNQGFSFDASRASSVYKNGLNKVYPAHVNLYWCIKY